MPSDDKLIARVAAYARRHGLLPSGAPVLAMVSGGPDSTFLMHALAAIHDGRVDVLVVDHGLRPEAGAEAAGVAAAAKALGLRARVASLGLPAGPAVQARARAGRLAVAREMAARDGHARIALGHTASDQAETVLFRLARGSGRDGALGMAPRRDELVRPLLCLTASETRAWCAERGIAVVRDPSNADPAHARVRVREGLLPALGAVHPDAERHVAAFADLLRDEAELLAPLVEDAWRRTARAGGLDAAALAREPAAMRRLLVRRLVAGAGLPGDALGAAAVARILDAAAGGRAAALPGGGRAALERGLLVVSAPAGAPPEHAALEVPGRATFGRLAITATEGRGARPLPDRVAVAARGPLTVRPPRPGDRLALEGGGHAAVGRLLAGAGVPARLRQLVPVVAAGERVVWVAGHRAAGDLVRTDGPAVVLSLEAAPA